MLTLCCSENHQEICYEGIACPLCKAMEDVEALKIESLKPCVTCDVFNENERLKDFIQKKHPKHRHDHDYYHINCTLCGLEKIAYKEVSQALKG